MPFATDYPINSCCVGCETSTDGNADGETLNGGFLYAKGLRSPEADHHNRAELEDYLDDLAALPCASQFLRVLKQVVRYHQPCIQYTIGTGFDGGYTYPLSYAEFKRCVDKLIPMVEGWVPAGNILLTNELSAPIPLKDRLDDDFKIVLLSWLFRKHFGNKAGPYPSANTERFRPFIGPDALFEIMKELSRIVDTLLCVVHCIVREAVINLDDPSCIVGEVPRLPLSLVQFPFYHRLLSLQNTNCYQSITALCILLHMGIRKTPGLPRLFHPEQPDAVDLLCDEPGLHN